MEDNKIREKFKEQISSLQNINSIRAIANIENIKDIDSKNYNYLIFQFEKVKKYLNKLEEIQNIFEKDVDKAKFERRSQKGNIKTSIQVINVFEFLDNWESFLSGIKQSLDFILKIFKEKYICENCNPIGFYDIEYSKIIELPYIFDDKDQYKNIITTRNAFVHNFYMKEINFKDKEFKLKYLKKID